MKPIKTFIIRHKETKEVWKASSGKSSWKAVGPAKNAWVGSSQPENFKKDTKYSWKENMKFDEQDEYEIVELLPESDVKLQEACELLRVTLQNLPSYCYYVREQVNNFLKENYNAEDNTL